MYQNAFWGDTITPSGGGGGGDGGLAEEDVITIIDEYVTKPYVVNLGIPGEASSVVPSLVHPGAAASSDVAYNLNGKKTSDILTLAPFQSTDDYPPWRYIQLSSLNAGNAYASDRANEATNALALGGLAANQFWQRSETVSNALSANNALSLGGNAASEYYKKTDTVTNATTAQTATSATSAITANNALALNGTPANGFYLKTDTVANAAQAVNAQYLGGVDASGFLRTDETALYAIGANHSVSADTATSATTAADASKLGGVLPSGYYLKTDTVTNAVHAQTATDADSLGGVLAADYLKKSQTASAADYATYANNSGYLGGVLASGYALRAELGSRPVIRVTGGTSSYAQPSHVNKTVLIEGDYNQSYTYWLNNNTMSGVDWSALGGSIQLINHHVGRLYVGAESATVVWRFNRSTRIPDSETYSTNTNGCMTLYVMFYNGSGYEWSITGDVDVNA